MYCNAIYQLCKFISNSTAVKQSNADFTFCTGGSAQCTHAVSSLWDFRNSNHNFMLRKRDRTIDYTSKKTWLHSWENSDSTALCAHSKAWCMVMGILLQLRSWRSSHFCHEERANTTFCRCFFSRLNCSQCCCYVYPDGCRILLTNQMRISLCTADPLAADSQNTPLISSLCLISSSLFSSPCILQWFPLFCPCSPQVWD